DKDCFVVMTLSGAMTVGKMGLVFCDLVESGVVRAIVSTGALMAHGLVEATGHSHFRYNPKMDDRELFKAGYNRVYDSLEPEVNLDAVEAVMQQILKNWNADDVVCSYKINQRIGEYLARHAKGRGILKSAAERNVPVFVPAFTDSELGIDFALHQRLRKKAGQPPLRFDPYEDFEYYAKTMLATKRMGLLTIGGGARAARVRKAAAQAVQLRSAHLPGAGQLGRTLRQHIYGSCFVGEVRAAGRGRALRRSSRRRHCGASARCRRCSSASGLLQDGQTVGAEMTARSHPSRASVVVAEQNCGCENRGPQSALIPDRRLSDVHGANDLVRNAVDLFFLVPR